MQIAEQEFHLRFPSLLYDWLRSEIPSWKPDLSPRYPLNSQPLVALIPEADTAPAGLVYFKGMADPLWSKDDVAALEESSHSWILLVLNPFDRFYEFDPILQELVGSSSRMAIWRPDSPRAEEVARLRKQALHYVASGIEQAADHAEARAETHNILRALYIQRGQFIATSGRKRIGDEIEDRSLARYLAARLKETVTLAGGPAAQRTATGPVPMNDRSFEGKALHWAALLAGMDEAQLPGLPAAERQLKDWRAKVFDVGYCALRTSLHPLPEMFMTRRISEEVKFFEDHLELLKPAIEGWQSDETSFAEAMNQIESRFNHDEARLLAWQASYRTLSALMQWAPSFGHAYEYLCGAFPTDQEELDRMRQDLLKTADHPNRFLEPAERDDFDRKFRDFKTGYLDYYHSVHEDALQFIGSGERESKIDSLGLRNLELLSRLRHTDKRYLNRVRIIGRWIRRNRCNLPVREILERHPRCFCNFDPASSRQWPDPAGQVNALIDEGIDYFRTILRQCRKVIIAELQILEADESHCRQIAALLSSGPMTQMDPEAVDILNKVIEKHSVDLLAAIRSYRKQSGQF